MEVAYEGECLTFACPRNIDPVCSNGKTHDNACLALSNFIAFKGECAKIAINVMGPSDMEADTSDMEVAIEDTESTEVSPSDMVDAEPAAAATGDDVEMISSASSAILSSAAVLAISAFIFVAI